MGASVKCKKNERTEPSFEKSEETCVHACGHDVHVEVRGHLCGSGSLYFYVGSGSKLRSLGLVGKHFYLLSPGETFISFPNL